MKKVIITPLEVIGSDERGSTFKGNLQKMISDFLFLTRKANTVSGNTYHEGTNKGTNPKTLVLLQGEIEFSYREIGSDKPEIVSIDYPAVIQVKPMVTHTVKTITDCCLLEANSIEDIRNDRKHENVLIEETGSNGMVGLITETS